MKSIGISILVSIFITASGFQAFGDEWTAEQKEVWNVVVEDVEYFKKGEFDKIMEKRHDNSIVWGHRKALPYSEVVSAYQYKGWFRYVIPTNWELNPIAIKISGNIAIVAYTYKITGEDTTHSGRSFDVWVKQNNKWLLLGSSDTSCMYAAECQ